MLNAIIDGSFRSSPCWLAHASQSFWSMASLTISANVSSTDFRSTRSLFFSLLLRALAACPPVLIICASSASLPKKTFRNYKKNSVKTWSKHSKHQMKLLTYLERQANIHKSKLKKNIKRDTYICMNYFSAHKNCLDQKQKCYMRGKHGHNMVTLYYILRYSTKFSLKKKKSLIKCDISLNNKVQLNVSMKLWTIWGYRKQNWCCEKEGVYSCRAFCCINPWHGIARVFSVPY